MKKFYTASEVKIATTNAATAAATQAALEGSKKAAAVGGLGMLLGAAITFTAGRSYCKRIEKETVESNNELKKDIAVLRAGIVEVDKSFDLLEKNGVHIDTSKLPDFIKARALVNEKGMTPLPIPNAPADDKKKENKKKKEENKNKKGGDK